jgi:hypothetical protein
VRGAADDSRPAHRSSFQICAASGFQICAASGQLAVTAVDGGRSSPPVLPRPGAESRPEIGAWTLQTKVYRLIGDGGLDLAAHLGDSIEVSGNLDAKNESGGDPPVNGNITVRTAALVADDCLPEIRR